MERPVIAPVKCLLVDDLEENLAALRALLRDDDVELLEARSGREALELLLAHDVALVLLDVQMPEMDGFEVAELMRGSARTRNVPIIFITAGAHDQNRVFKGYESGAVDFLHKPVDAHILRNKASVFFELARQRNQIAAQLREREQTLRLNEMFMAVLGHDLRSPLSAVRLGAELLQRWSQEDKVKDVSARILSSTSHMMAMIEDLLDVARSRQGRGMPVDPKPNDLGAIAQAALQEQRMVFPDRVVELEKQGDLEGRWDAGRLQQLLANLLGNALRHGDRVQSVALRLDGSALHHVSLTVANGGTIPEEMRPSLFDPFHGEQRSRKRHGGLGLGLYICREIVAAHNGVIEVQSAPETGTWITTTLPRRVD